MNWISIISQVFFAVLLTSLTGTIMFIVWFLCRIIFQKRNPKFVYYMLRWVVIMYIVPITYIAFITHYDSGYIKPMEGILKSLFVMDMNNMLYQGVMLTWVVMVIVIMGFCLKNLIGRYRICKCNFEDGESLAQTEFERIKKKIGLEEEVVLLRNDHPRLQTPFVTGVFHTKVIIPYFNYSRSELDVILYHELNHIKKSDVLFRYLTIIAIIINSINPIAYLLWSQILTWSEADCDARALDCLEEEEYSKGNYYDIIWQMIRYGPEEPTIFYHPMLVNSKSNFYRRIEIMEKYRANMKKTAKSVVMAWVLAVAMLSTVTAHAAGVQLAGASDKALKESQEINVDDVVMVPDSEEMLVEADEDVTTIYINDEIMLYGTGNINWDVPVGTRCVSGSIYMTAGTEVTIACTAQPADCLYWFGLMYASSTCNVVEVTGAAGHTFTVPSNGYYRIMVENRGSEAMTVRGSYIY